MGRKELAVDEESITRKGPPPPLVIDDLEGVGDASLCQRMGRGLGLAQGVARVPDHLVDRVTRALGGNEALHHGPGPVAPGGHQVARGDHPGHFRIESGAIVIVGPADLSSLDGQVELVADVGPGRPTVGRRAVTRTGIGIRGVALPTVDPQSEDLGPPTGPLVASGRTSLDELGLSGLAVELDRHRLAVEGSPRFNVGPVDRQRMAEEELLGHSRPGQLVGEPCGINTRLLQFEDTTELGKEAGYSGIGLGWVPTRDTEVETLLVGERIKCASDLDEVPLVMATQGIELAGDQKTQEAEVARPPDFGVNEGLENVDDPRTLDQLASQIQLAGVGWATSAFVEGGADYLSAPRSMGCASFSGNGDTNPRRSVSMAVPRRPAAATSSGSRVPALRCQHSQVERRRDRESRGCPGGTSSRESRALARFRDTV